MEEALDDDMKVFKAIKSYQLQNLNDLAINVIVDRLNLEPFYEFLKTFNKSNFLPYHNFYHSTCVFLNCYEGAYYSNLDDEEIRGLCAAALLHDFGHSGGKLVDSENIKIALNGLKTANLYASSKMMGLSEKSMKIAIESISITQYPFLRNPSTQSESIIRDADLMQPYENWDSKLINQYVGLKEEIEIQRGVSYTMSEFADGVKAFIETTDWHTEWAHEKAKTRNFDMVKSKLVSSLKDFK